MADEVATLIFKAESGDLVKAEAVLKRVEKQGQRTEKASDGMASGLKRAAVAFLGVVGAAAGMRKLVSAARTFDVLNAQLVTATGSAEKAKEAFAAIEKFAATTPFQIDEITEAFVKLRNMGLDPSEKALLSYGNTASALGRTLDEIVLAVAGATVGENDRLKLLGIQTKVHGDLITFTFQGMSTTVKKSASEIEGYMRSIGDINFAGASAERAKTLDGALSNLEDAWNSLFMAASQDGAGDEMARQIRDLAALLKDPQTIAAAQKLAGAIVTAFSKSAEALRWTVEATEDLAEAFAFLDTGVAALDNLNHMTLELANNRAAMAGLYEKEGEQLDGLTAKQQADILALGKRNEVLKEYIEIAKTAKDSPDESPQTGGGGVLGQSKVVGEGEGGGGTSMTAARERELERLRESFMTEEQLEIAHYQTKLEQIKSFEEEKKILDDEAKAMREQAEAEHQAKLHDIKLEQQNKDTEGFQNTLSMAEKYYSGLEGKEAAHARAVLQGMRILSDAKKRDALKNATVKGFEGIQEAVASAPFPLNLIPIAFATAQMAGNIAGITSARALGGQVMPDSPYLVGERGPELFVPGAQGNIVTNEKLRGGGEAPTESREVRVSFNINALDGANVEQVLSDQRGFIFSMINDAVNDSGRGALI